MYDPTVGRWLSEDPIRFGAGDTNLTRYVGNNPMNATDPSGLQQPALKQPGETVNFTWPKLPAAFSGALADPNDPKKPLPHLFESQPVLGEFHQLLGNFPNKREDVLSAIVSPWLGGWEGEIGELRTRISFDQPVAGKYRATIQALVDENQFDLKAFDNTIPVKITVTGLARGELRIDREFTTGVITDPGFGLGLGIGIDATDVFYFDNLKTRFGIFAVQGAALTRFGLSFESSFDASVSSGSLFGRVRVDAGEGIIDPIPTNLEELKRTLERQFVKDISLRDRNSILSSLTAGLTWGSTTFDATIHYGVGGQYSATITGWMSNLEPQAFPGTLN